MSDNTKRTGENKARINIQMRFVPESEIEAKKVQVTTEPVTITVRDDEDKKGMADNLRQIDLTKIHTLAGCGETFAVNRYKLQTTIFNYKGWTGPEWFEKRMTILTQTLKETVMLNLVVAQKRARREFLDFYLASTTERERSAELDDEKSFLRFDYIFLPWLRDKRVLFKLNYLSTANPDVDEALQAYHNAIDDYERGIFYYCSQMAWKDSTMAYRNHHKYFTNSIVKPFNMSVDDYVTRMNEYAELLLYLPPPSRKGSKSSDADWDTLKPLRDADIRAAIYDGLPEPYKNHVSNKYKEDWINMEEANFLDALRAYEKTDQNKRRDAEASKEKEKKRRADAPKSKGKRTSDDDVNPRSTKCYRNCDGYRGKSRDREPCSYCSRQTDWKKDRAHTHTTDSCFFKDKKPKESNLASRMERIEKLLEKSVKRSKKDKGDSSDDSD
jgi:hypothetical protein